MHGRAARLGDYINRIPSGRVIIYKLSIALLEMSQLPSLTPWSANILVIHLPG